MRITYQLVQGHSAYDHYATEIIAVARQERPATKRQAEAALARAWRAVRPHAAIAPMIRVTTAR